MPRLHSFIGFLALIFLAWIFSENRRKISVRTLLTGMGLQMFLALLLLKFPGNQQVFLYLNSVVKAIEESTRAGTGFVFGYLGGGTLPFKETVPGSSYILAFRGLPLVLVIGALSALLFHWGIIPRVVKAFSWVLRRIMGIGGVEGLGAAANVFVGMVESPLIVRPYLAEISRSELFTIMVCGMATIAGTVMVLYASILREVIPGVMGHLLVASIISAPAAITVAKLMIPETSRLSGKDPDIPVEAKSAMDAITRGTLIGVRLLINIVAMLIVFVALLHLLNLILAFLPEIFGKPVTFQRLVGYVMAPVTYLMGIPWSEAQTAGSLMGTKTVLNEFLAYLHMAALPAGTLSKRSELIMIYAMCGFANFGSLGIMIGGMGAMARERREEIVGLGLRSILAGTIATCMTGALVGIIY
ncbi:MAG: nucleoside:proton symporter [Deltaproteobacteria bacterium]|nr:nucleoside:proton symporter [Deltaproteobacteria bacterium]MBW2047135.1 nucleoside:proton symporter [Deltaproteobacteria bacterium]MBW2351837.1 nucleoside:proton symporter [Deltaproteobacteria bacterium]HDZ91501.1 nucleoside:proton symporter [Deltaproteobacteria bacterium]